MPPLGKETWWFKRNEIKKSPPFMRVLSVWSWAACSPLAPGQAIISSDTRGRPDPTPPLTGPRGWKGWEGLAVLQAQSLRSSFLFDHRPPTSMSPKQGAGAGGTRRWACIPSLQPLFPPNMKKGLIVFNNMLSNLPPPPSPPPSPPWLELESHLAPCSVPHYCWISLQAAPVGGSAPGF